jgi:hypothetical protein
MRYQNVGHIALRVARIAGMSGGAAAVGSVLKLFPIGKLRTVKPVLCLSLLGAAIALFQFQQVRADDDEKAARFIPSVIVSSAVPANGDGNPYGTAFVPRGFPQPGPLKPGDLLVSNFNNSVPTQGTGTTIIKFTPVNGQVVASGSASVFFQGSPGLGLTTALGVLRRGFVIVGSVPTTMGTFATIQPGSLLILDRNGKIVVTLTDQNLLDSPWDLTVQDEGHVAKVFVSNVVSGTVTRLDLSIPINGIPVVMSETRIAKGYMVQPNKAAVILGPTGVAYDAEKDVLYVASTADNAIYVVPNAARRTTPPANGTGAVFIRNSHLRGPLGLVLAPNGDLITTNGDAVNGDLGQPSEVVEFSRAGRFVGQFNVDPAQGGAFGIAVERSGEDRAKLAVVNDNTNDVSVYTLQERNSD